MPTRPLFIFDLDGTLALIEHRRHFITAPKCKTCNGGGKYGSMFDNCYVCQGSGDDPSFKADWPAFYAACVDDQPNTPVINTLRALRLAGAEVQIWSGRSDEVINPTVSWLINNVDMPGHTPIELRMRAAGDFTPDDILKQYWLAFMSPEDRARLVGVFDDRQKVVDMWRANGVTCFQVAPGEF